MELDYEVAMKSVGARPVYSGSSAEEEQRGSCLNTATMTRKQGAPSLQIKMDRGRFSREGKLFNRRMFSAFIIYCRGQLAKIIV
jgi:hypothetical protein